MTERNPRATQHVDSDGVRTIERPGVRTSVWLLALAMALVGIALFVVIRPLIQAPQIASDERRVPDVNVEAPRPTALPPIAPHVSETGDARRPPHAEPQREVRKPPPPAQVAPEPAAEPDAPTQPDAEQPSGIALFPPPGTKPMKRGIVVPDDVELPPGFVRHYQTTDDGQQLPAILMFHPDYHPVDENGAPIELPDDRIVPPEMAPSGIPVQMLEVPEEGAPPQGGPTTGRRQADR